MDFGICRENPVNCDEKKRRRRTSYVKTFKFLVGNLPLFWVIQKNTQKKRKVRVFVKIAVEISSRKIGKVLRHLPLEPGKRLPGEKTFFLEVFESTK